MVCGRMIDTHNP